MFWKTNSTRTASRVLCRAEAALRRVSDFGGLQLAGFTPVPGSFRPPGQPWTILARSAAPGAGANRGAGGKSGPETAYSAQPSGPDGVPEDMATMVLDNPAMGTGSALQPGLQSSAMRDAGLRPEVDPASDAAVMLRVAAGDEAG